MGRRSGSKNKGFFGSKESEEASKPGVDSADESQKDEAEPKADEAKETESSDEVETDNEIPGKYRKFQ